jgi:hypothetical protein
MKPFHRIFGRVVRQKLPGLYVQDSGYPIRHFGSGKFAENLYIFVSVALFEPE